MIYEESEIERQDIRSAISILQDIEAETIDELKDLLALSSDVEKTLGKNWGEKYRMMREILDEHIYLLKQAAKERA